MLKVTRGRFDTTLVFMSVRYGAGAQLFDMDEVPVKFSGPAVERIRWQVIQKTLNEDPGKRLPI